MKEIRFIHMADLHLDSPFLGLSNLPEELYAEIKNAPFTALKKAISIAISEQVDFVLIAGDVYDKEIQSIKAEVEFYNEMKRLFVAEIDVFLIYGNHDFRGYHHDALVLPDNVHVFGPEISQFDWQKQGRPHVKLYGFSYDKKHITDKRVNDYEKSGMADFHIALLHGTEAAHVKGDVYAPFVTSELKRKGFDYWALGHIHKRQALSTSPVIYYPGNIQGRHFKEVKEKGITLVNLSEQETNLQFIPVAPITWLDVQIELDQPVSKSTVFLALTSKLADFSEKKSSYLLHIELLFQEETPLLKENWLEMLNDNYLFEDGHFIWVNKLTTRMKAKAVDGNWWQKDLLSAEWEKAKDDLLEESAFFNRIESLYFHPNISRYLPEIKKEKRQEIILAALQKIGDSLAEVEDERN
ncbi:DNA repair exonuclease [Listeria sp. PSOL-1]|uniref:metallophosphoesterase family protein n=1 Tax=Listeria sp. PSOL-1 TaxID=1844999 RepID=UPI0013D6A53F|nr:DNA repair exonuclease [Listeria sp. PSOL-1]